MTQRPPLVTQDYVDCYAISVIYLRPGICTSPVSIWTLDSPLAWILCTLVHVQFELLLFALTITSQNQPNIHHDLLRPLSIYFCFYLLYVYYNHI